MSQVCVSLAGLARGVQRHSTVMGRCAVSYMSNRSHMSTQAAATAPKVAKFYKEVGVESDDEGFLVTLDGRRLKTPNKSKLTIPTEALADMVAQEWDSQTEHILLTSMHITNLCNSAIDNTGYTHDSRVTAMMEYLHTDTIVFRETSPSDWHALQVDKWDPIVAWAEEKFGVGIVTTEGIFPPDMPEKTMATMRSVVDSFGDSTVQPGSVDFSTWGLAGLEHLTSTSKSLLITLALLDGHLTTSDAAEAARLETVFQTSRFGEVEWHHTLEQHDTTTRLGAAALFTRQCMYARQSAE